MKNTELSDGKDITERSSEKYLIEWTIENQFTELSIIKGASDGFGDPAFLDSLVGPDW